MKERVVDRKYDPLVWLGNKIPRRVAVAANRALDSGDAADGRGAGPRPAAQQAVGPRGAAHPAATRCTPRAGSRRRPRRPGPQVEHAGRGRIGPAGARWAATPGRCCAPSRPASSSWTGSRTRSRPRCSRRSGWRAPAPLLAGTHALHHLVHGRLAEAVEHAREAIVWDRTAPTRADDLITLSEALAGLGEYDESASAMGEAQSLWPDNPRLAGARANLEDMNVHG